MWLWHDGVISRHRWRFVLVAACSRRVCDETHLVSQIPPRLAVGAEVRLLVLREVRHVSRLRKQQGGRRRSCNAAAAALSGGKEKRPASVLAQPSAVGGLGENRTTADGWPARRRVFFVYVWLANHASIKTTIGAKVKRLVYNPTDFSSTREKTQPPLGAIRAVFLSKIVPVLQAVRIECGL